MSKEILNLDPKQVWKNFYSLTQIPRPSKKEAQIIKFMQEFGANLKLETLTDEVGNVLIRKPATPGMENRKGVILQTHLDMVPQKNNDTVHDFDKDPIHAYIDGEWVKAKGTTLGSDNGMGVAAAMALLESTDIPHGPLEALFTVDEETGMTGAFGLKAGWLQGEILINLDSEHEEELCIGCAGGMDANISLPYTEIPAPADMKAFQVAVKGLKGGHSGIDIALGRGNSNKLLFRFLNHAIKYIDVQLVSVSGGSLRNAIPRESFAVVLVSLEKELEFRDAVQSFQTIYKNELKETEPDLKMEISPAENSGKMISPSAQTRLIKSVYACPNGVIRMSDSVPGLVETSNNLAIVRTEKGIAQISCLMRSSVDSAKEDVGQMIKALFELIGAEVKLEGSYPGWKPNADSDILKVMKKVYTDVNGKDAHIIAVHAGLECGLIGGLYPGMDMISCGPTIRFPHSPDEMVNIKSVGKFFHFLCESLKKVPAK